MEHQRADRRLTQELKKCRESYRPDAPDIMTGMDSGVCSANECTGLIPGGGDLSAEEFAQYGEFYSFSVPAKEDKK